MSTAQGAWERLLNHIWYSNSLLSWCLIPLTWPVRWAIHRRRQQAAPKGSTPDGITVIEIGSGRAGSLEDTGGLVAAPYGRGVHLIRPDQHLAARWAAPTPGDITSALARCASLHTLNLTASNYLKNLAQKPR